MTNSADKKSNGESNRSEKIAVLPPVENALFLTGPTASGKTTVGVEWAERRGAEIISLDSMAVYRQMDIGTAKPTEAERRGVVHHLIDIVEPSEEFSLAAYLRRAHRAVEEILTRGKTPLFVGGTPLYLKALVSGIFEGPEADPILRTELLKSEKTLGAGTLHRRLAAFDPASAERLHPNDTKRIIRAIEVFEKTGRPLGDFQYQFHQQPNTEPKIAVLDWPRPTLYERIDRRVDAMMSDGLLDEARRLAEISPPLSKTAAGAIGYRELFGFLAGKTTLDEAVSQIKQASRNFAKRQITWFRSFANAEFIPMTEPFDRKKIAETLFR